MLRTLSLCILFYCFGGASRAQDCNIPFTLPLFGVQVEHDVLYGVATRYNGAPDSLRLNLYKPIGDGQTERPLLIVIHGGGFVSGSRNDLNDLCQTMASMGWAAVTISYRLGYYGTGILDAPYAYDANEFRRANYRAMQDAKGAIRFLKARHLQDSTSTTNVLMVGFSAGALTALQAAYMDKPEEKPTAAGAIGQVQHFFNFYPRPDLGDVEGDLNQNGEDANVLGLVSIFGALLDTAYIETADDPALYMYHQTGDPVVGCGVQQPYWGIPLGPSGNLPWMFGSCAIDVHVQGLDFAPGRYEFQLFPGNEHDIHDPAGVLIHSMFWMRELFCGGSTSFADMVLEENAFTVYPNPSEGNFSITRSCSGDAFIEVFDTAGRKMFSTRMHGDRIELDLYDSPPGNYLVRIIAETGTFQRSVIIW